LRGRAPGFATLQHAADYIMKLPEDVQQDKRGRLRSRKIKGTLIKRRGNRGGC